MGCFSWLDCTTHKPIKIGTKAYMLIPKEFTNIYGTQAVCENAYDGYGRFGSYDIYNEVALWNRDNIDESNLRPAPTLEKFGGLYSYQIEDLKKEGKTEDEIKQIDNGIRQKYFEAAMNRRKQILQMIDDFKNRTATDDEMAEMYGTDWLRNIGIAIACYDEQNAKLKYPIKLAHAKSKAYEACGPSDSDPDQGF